MLFAAQKNRLLLPAAIGGITGSILLTDFNGLKHLAHDQHTLMHKLLLTHCHMLSKHQSQPMVSGYPSHTDFQWLHVNG